MGKTAAVVQLLPTTWADFSKLLGPTSPNYLGRLLPTTWADFSKLLGPTSPNYLGRLLQRHGPSSLGLWPTSRAPQPWAAEIARRKWEI